MTVRPLAYGAVPCPVHLTVTLDDAASMTERLEALAILGIPQKAVSGSNAGSLGATDGKFSSREKSHGF